MEFFYLLRLSFFYFKYIVTFQDSDIAIGAAKVMGYDLMENFRVPYISRSIKEFWDRWHISLSSWFRDYLYIPLGGNRVVRWRWYYNLFIVFLVSGFWHGANWTFVIWGALHGVYAWIFFRGGSIEQALLIIHKIGSVYQYSFASIELLNDVTLIMIIIFCFFGEVDFIYFQF